MTTRHQFMQWLEQIDPDVQFDDIDQRTLFISPSDDSPLLDTEAMFDIESPEMFQFLSIYVREFSCMWQYKNTELWREGDVWGLSHVFPNKTALQLSLADAPTDLDLFNYIIMMNDGRLPYTLPDDSPDHTQAMIDLAEKANEMRGTHKAWDNLASVFDMGEDWFSARKITNRHQFVATIAVGLVLGYDSWADFTNWDEIPDNMKFVKEIDPQYVDWSRVVEGLFNVDEERSQYLDIENESPIAPINPYRIAMSLVNNGYYSPLNPLTSNSPFDWMREVKSTAYEESDMFLGEDANFDDYDWEQAYSDAFDEIKAWFWTWRNSPTTTQLEDAIQWLKDCDSELEIIRDLEERLGEIMGFESDENEQEIDVEREGKQ